MSILRQADRCANIIVDREGTVRNIAREETKPWLVSAKREDRGWRWFCRYMNAGEKEECKANILETVWFESGTPKVWYFTTHRGTISKKTLSGTNIRAVREAFHEISSSYESDSVAISYDMNSQHHVLSRDDFEALYGSRNFSKIRYLAAFIPARNHGHKSCHGFANYLHEFIIKRDGQPQHISYKLDAPIGFPSRNSSITRGKTRSTAVTINRQLSNMIRAVVTHVENIAGCRVIRLSCYFVLDPDDVAWIAHMENIQIVRNATRNTKNSPRHSPHRRWANPRTRNDEEEEEELVVDHGLRMFDTAPARFNFMDDDTDSKRDELSKRTWRPYMTNTSTMSSSLKSSTTLLGSSQHIKGCPGDFCDFDLENQAASLRKIDDLRLNSSSSSNFMTKSSSSMLARKRGGQLVPVGPNSLTFRAIAQARAEKRLVRLLLERQSRGETGDYFTQNFQSEVSASLGKTFASSYYREVRVCNKCFRMYTKIHTLREDAIRKLQKRKVMITSTSSSSSSMERKEDDIMSWGDPLIETTDSFQHNKTMKKKKKKKKNRRRRRHQEDKEEEKADVIRESIDSLTKYDISELRAFSKPPSGVSMVISALLVLIRGEPPESWREAQKFMTNPKFMSMLVAASDSDLVTPEILDALEPFLRQSQFRPENIQRVSSCASRLCEFVRAVSREAAEKMGRDDILTVLSSSWKESNASWKDGNTSFKDTTMSSKSQLGASTRRAAERSRARNKKEKKKKNSNATTTMNTTYIPSLATNRNTKGRPMLTNFMQPLQRRNEKMKKKREKKNETSTPESQQPKPQQKTEKERRVLAQQKATERLHDPHNLKNGAAMGAKKYQCSDGATMSYLVVGKADVNLTHTCFVVVNDFFETYESAQVLFRSVVANEIGTQVLLLNLPGQAYTTLPLKDKIVLNNEYMASRLHELLQHLEISGDFFSATRPFHLVGFGNGANIATSFASIHGHHVDTYCLQSLVLINGYAVLDAELTANLTSTENVFQCLPPDKPELARDYFKQYLLSREYVDRVGKDMAWNLLTAISNPISMAGTYLPSFQIQITIYTQTYTPGRLLLLKGAMLHVDLTKRGLKTCRGIPMIVVHSTENKLVSSSHVTRLVEGRNVQHIYAHQQTKADGITEDSKNLLENVLRSSKKENHRAAVLWFKCGHQISIEEKKKLMDLFRSLARHVVRVEDEKDEDTKQKEAEQQEEKRLREETAKELKSLEVDNSKRFENKNKTDIEQEYQSTKHEYDRESKLEALLRDDDEEEKQDDETKKGKTELTIEVNTPADDIKTRLEKKLEAFEQQKALRAKKLREEYEAQTEKLRESSEIRREEWKLEDSARIDALELALEERRKEREAEELSRSQRIDHYNLKKNVVIRKQELEQDDQKQDDEEKQEKTATTTTANILDQLEAEDKKKEEEKRAERIAAAEQEKKKRDEFERVRDELRQAEKDRQLELARQEALEEELLRDEVAVHIQKIVRGILGRRRANQIREEKEMEEICAMSALRLTAAARMLLAKIRVRDMKKEEERRCAAMIIAEDLQRIFRGVRGRKNASRMRRDRSARDMQRVIRGFVGRRQYAKEVKRAKQREKEKNAAIKMQSVFRRHKGMIVYQQRLLEDIASTTIQRMYRGVLGRRVSNRKRMWQKSEPGPERLELGLKLVKKSEERFKEHRQEIEKLHQKQERTEARVSLIHAGLKQSEKELAKLEEELQQIDQLDRDLKELTHEKELFDLEIRRDGASTLESNFESGVSIGDGGAVRNSTSMNSNGARVADAYVFFVDLSLSHSLSLVLLTKSQLTKFNHTQSLTHLIKQVRIGDGYSSKTR